MFCVHALTQQLQIPLRSPILTMQDPSFHRRWACKRKSVIDGTVHNASVDSALPGVCSASEWPRHKKTSHTTAPRSNFQFAVQAHHEMLKVCCAQPPHRNRHPCWCLLLYDGIRVPAVSGKGVSWCPKCWEINFGPKSWCKQSVALSRSSYKEDAQLREVNRVFRQ